MSKLTELTTKLKEIFQINRADLDFGIYRILNSRNREISDYLEKKLPAKVQAAFADSQQTQIVQWQKELEQLKKTLADAGVEADSSPKVQALQEQIKQATQNGANGEAAVFSHLLTFFSRYYDEGDFISQRRYKGNTYAIPYNGEEVMLHWANKDQYYTKSGENFSNYRFKLEDGCEVLFRLIAADTEKDNRKENDKKRLFVLAEPRMIEKQDEDGEEVYEEELKSIVETDNGNTLEIRFEYRISEKSQDCTKEQDNPAKDNSINGQTVQEVLSHPIVAEKWQTALKALCPTEASPMRTLLRKHISVYTQKNTADYFIHKDLGGFLRRELDFYIKNEVMHLDNIQHADGIKVIEQSLRQIQVIRSIAHDLIDFLAQLEDFQKKLWLKKKFVAGCHYLITLDYVPEELLPTVVNNERQQTAWQQLFAVTVDKNADAQSFAQQYPHLVVDTSLFPQSFQTRLLSAISDEHPLDEATDGVLIHADNLQALNLLQARYREQVKCIMDYNYV
ncbi:restriction endonuclease subunit M [Gallibacterium genomosp. 3]|uniref:restriction endonuclease subunit M n=1 Tax=Gallibacterium genomosp. 3 TaxID=505345 RepID=UPI000802691C|nr:restriction endonuclease subunit M [Gallibacterium genomosp. 3]